MPLFRLPRAKTRPKQRVFMKKKLMPSSWRTDEDGSVVPLTRLCLLSLAENMKNIWAKDYADNYMDHYSFRCIMGPFNCLPGELVEELIWLLCTQKQLTRAALHLLLVPQLRSLSLDKSSGLVTSALCFHISARCEGLWSLDLSGAHQLPSKALSQTIGTLPNLRSLCLMGTLCDGAVVRTIALCCRSLRHLDITRCHFIPPSALFHLGRLAPSPSPEGHCKDSSPSQCYYSSSLSLPSLRSLYALDIGFGEEEGETVAAAAYLLLSLPVLEKVALDGFSQACHLIQCREFDRGNKFTDRVGVARLADLFWEKRRMQAGDGERGANEGPVADEEDEETSLWEGYEGQCEEGSSGDKGAGCLQVEDFEQSNKRVVSQADDEGVTLCLKEVKSLSCECLSSLGPLCPNLCSISVNICDDEDDRERDHGSLLAECLQTWCGQLCCLSVQYLGHVIDVFPAVEVVGSSLLSLTLEGVKTSPYTPLLKLIKACPRLMELHIIAERPHFVAHEDQEENELDDLPRLPNLRSLSLKFSFKQSQRPLRTWLSLRQVIECLLAGSLLLEKLSLWSLPCDLNIILDQLLHRRPRLPSLPSPPDSPLIPLGQALYVELPWTDVQESTVSRLMQQCKGLRYLDISNCWGITKQDLSSWRTYKRVTVVWC